MFRTTFLCKIQIFMVNLDKWMNSKSFLGIKSLAFSLRLEPMMESAFPTACSSRRRRVGKDFWFSPILMLLLSFCKRNAVLQFSQVVCQQKQHRKLLTSMLQVSLEASYTMAGGLWGLFLIKMFLVKFQLMVKMFHSGGGQWGCSVFPFTLSLWH